MYSGFHWTFFFFLSLLLQKINGNWTTETLVTTVPPTTSGLSTAGLIGITVGIGGTIFLTLLVLALLIVGVVIIVCKKHENGTDNAADTLIESVGPSINMILSFSVKENVAYGKTAVDSTIHISDNVAYAQTESATQSTKEINSSAAYDTVCNFQV
ncbi:PREDICTED: uncharacterized protein LOC109589009 [Amphimedon queenslandica]|uniref:Uncharacterized protein n=1 Tax=Amphimedon queenslandica TaxID=400682 RepID=A0A1X7TAN8_AMPQE|nr:PREDICTED: uncharacterized protein LOC109589009 [Amphimedon queenslandica]|eukprot:XP_019860689.1 PREDICTED: uncharacterized protein LOC109589009 [Amphimedon queenslandica]